MKAGHSKYDFVKVRVFLSATHSYVLSRYLICRTLTAIQVDYTRAVRIALDVKKRLVDNNQLSITQNELEQNHLFPALANDGDKVRLYRLLMHFHHTRVPFFLLIGGEKCTGKSTIAMGIAERLNMVNVIKTDFVKDVVGFDDEEVVVEALTKTIEKCLVGGKNIVVEGKHVGQKLLNKIRAMATSDTVVMPVYIRLEPKVHWHLAQQDHCERSIEQLQQNVTTWQENQRLNTKRFQDFHSLCISPDETLDDIDEVTDRLIDKLHVHILDSLSTFIQTSLHE